MDLRLREGKDLYPPTTGQACQPLSTYEYLTYNLVVQGILIHWLRSERVARNLQETFGVTLSRQP